MEVSNITLLLLQSMINKGMLVFFVRKEPYFFKKEGVGKCHGKKKAVCRHCRRFTVLREGGEPRSLLIPILSIMYCEVVLIPRENLAVLASCDILKRRHPFRTGCGRAKEKQHETS